jgi:hypothetical protein
MTTLSTVALQEFRVTFTLAAGSARRAFVFTIPAVDEKSALAGAYQMALGINDASGHVWKLTDEDAIAEVAS